MASPNRELSLAKLHQPLFVPGLGNIKASELDLNTKEYIRPTKMTLLDGYIDVELVNGQGAKVSIGVPITNCISWVYKKETLAKDNKAAATN